MAPTPPNSHDTVIGPGEVVTANIADGAVTAAKIASGAAASNVGAIGGDLAGTLPNPTIGAGKVIATSIASDAVTTVKILNGNVTLAKLAANLPYVLVQTGAPSTFTSPLVYDNTVVTGGLYGWTGSAYSKIGGLAS